MPTKTVLIVEDEAPLRELLHDAVEQAGFRVIACDDAADALTRAAGGAIDLVLLDLVMPRARMDGFAFLSEIRSRPNLVHTPLIIISGLGDIVAEAIDPAIAAALRIALVVPKPFDILALVDEICRILGEPQDDVSSAGAQ
jgi:two-component system, chemotaxis family, chemotaxis protein CheY